MKRRAVLFALTSALSTALPNIAAAAPDVVLACTFPSLPPVVMTFPQGTDPQGNAGGKRMSVGGRPAVPLTEGQGAARLITADLDGYHFRFAPQNSGMEVEQDGQLIASQTGTCVTIDGPVNDTPLTITPPDLDVPSADLSAQPDPRSPAPQQPVTAKDQGDWIVTEDTSAFDDSRTVVLTLASRAPVRGKYGTPAPATLLIRCKENTTAMFIVMNDMFLSDHQNFGAVDYRIDDQKASVARMSSSTDNKALGLWDGRRAIPFVKSLIPATTVVFRVTPYSESPIEAAFDLAGLQAAIIPLQEACRW